MTRSGFGMLEIIIVVAIVAALIGGGYYFYLDNVTKDAATIQTGTNAVREAQNAVQKFASSTAVEQDIVNQSGR